MPKNEKAEKAEVGGRSSGAYDLYHPVGNDSCYYSAQKMCATELVQLLRPPSPSNL